MSYKVAPLTVNPKQKSSLMSKAFVSQPSAEEELLVGRLFVLMEIDHSRAEDFALADFIVKEIYKLYYENEQFFLREKIANLKIDYIFEAALTKLNRGISEFIETQKFALHPGSLNIVIGVLHKNRLLFAHAGPNKAMLLYRPKAKAGAIQLDYNIVDISEKTQDPTQELATNSKLFANVVNGVIPSQGYFFFANEAALEYLSKKQLLEIITTLPPAGAAEQIKLLLEQTDAFVPFYALIVKNTTGEDYAATQNPTHGQALDAVPTMALGGQSSVERLNLTQEKTEQLLSPSGLLTVKKWLHKLQPKTTDLKNYAQDKARQLNLSASRLNSKRASWELGKKLIDFFRIVFALIADGLRAIFSWITNAEARASALKGLRNGTMKSVQALLSLPSRYARLTPRNKILITIIIICIVGLGGSLSYTAITYRQKQSQAKIADAQAQFTQKENQVEASLLYGNTEGARTLVSDMETILKGLPNKSNAEKAAVAELTKRYQTRLDSLYAITRLDKPAPFASLPAAAESIALAGSSLYATNGTAKNIYSIDANGQVATISNGAFSGQRLSALNDEDTAYFWDGTNLFRYSPADQSFKQATIENRPASVNLAGVYNTRLYTVSLQDNLIQRFNQDEKTFSFSNRMSWSKDALGLSGVNSMSIDGRIYLVGDKQIKKFSGGRNDNLVLDEISPKLEEPTLAAASADQAYLYVLEPSKRRLLVYSDEGKYIAQYTSDSFDALTGMAIDEANKKIYLLNGATIYRIDIASKTK